MGQAGSTFTDAEIEEYETLSFLNKSEILRLALTRFNKRCI